MNIDTTSAKIALIGFLLSTTAVQAQGETMGAIEMGISKYYWVLMLALLALLSMLYLEKKEDPIEVMGLVYDRDEHKLELTVRNTSKQAYQIQSALRLIHSLTGQDAPESEDGLAMSAGTAETPRTLYDLLAEDNQPVPVGPGETKKISYDVYMKPEQVSLESDHNVEVHINYGGAKGEPSVIKEKETQAKDKKKGEAKADKKKKGEKKTGENPEKITADLPEKEVIVTDIEFRPPFTLKASDTEIIAEPVLLQELVDAVDAAPEDAIKYHLGKSNDFADWVENAVGDTELAEKMREVKGDDKDAKKKIVKLLKTRKEKLPNPQVKPVDNAFLLKTSHDKIINEITLLGDLKEAIKNAPIAAVSFHLKEGNDFADWVESAVGEEELAEKMRKVKYDSILEAREELISVIESGIKDMQ